MGASYTKSANGKRPGTPDQLCNQNELEANLDETLIFNTTTSYLKLYFGNMKELVLTDLTINPKNWTWRFSKEFDYKVTRRVLKEEFLKIHLYKKTNKEIGHVHINLYDIATGPVHQDFVIKMKKKYKEPGRLHLDVKMSQLVHMVVKPQNVACKLKENLKEKFYNFNIKMSSKEQEFRTDHSKEFKNRYIPPVLVEKHHQDELIDENYQIIMDENKSIETNYLYSSDVNENYAKLRSKRPSSIQDTSESLRNEEDIGVPVRNRSLALHTKLDPQLSRKMSTIQATWAPNKDILWDFAGDTGSIPTLEIHLNVRDLASGTFQFFLWASKELFNHVINKANDSEVHNQEIYIDHKLVGECYVSMNKFFFGDGEMNFVDEVKFGAIFSNDQNGPKSTYIQKRLLQFNEKLWYGGVNIGEITGDFIVKNSNFYSQMICGVRTEEGVQKSGSLYLNKENTFPFFKNTNIKEMKNLETLKDNLKTVVFNFSNAKNNPKLRIKIIDELATNVQKVLEILKSSHKESMLSFLYKTPESLLASQRILIGIAKHLIEYADEVPNTLRPIYYESLLLIFERGEFELNYMGFDESYSEFLKNAQKMSFKNESGAPKVEVKNFQRKLEVCERYQTLLYQTLQKVLSKFNMKGLSDKEREFVEQFAAIVYFRIPEFRKKMLGRLYDEIKDINIDEWRGTEWKLEEDIDDEKKNKQFVSLFDWQGCFYVYLKNTEEGEKNYKILNEILEDRIWQNRVKKRGVAFFFFLDNWAKHVNKTVVTKEHVPWQDLPGYTILIKAMLVGLKTRDVRAYPEALISASTSLLKNDKLLNIFISILYKKTKIYDSSSVFTVYDIINKWFTALRISNKPIPTAFDTLFFFKGISLILKGDHALNIAKVLWLLYNNFNLFRYDQKQMIGELVLSTEFFNLFLHWSWNVRQIFYNFLLYRFYHQHRTTNTNLLTVDDIKKELLLYNQQRKNAVQTKKTLVNEFINVEYSRNITIIENSYKKLKEQQALRNPEKKGRKDSPRRANAQPRQISFPTKKVNAIAIEEQPEEENFVRLKLRTVNSESQKPQSSLKLLQTENDDQSKLSDQSSSSWIINPDKLDTSVQKSKTPVKKPSRSGSLFVGSQLWQDFGSAAAGNFDDIDAKLETKKKEEPKKVENRREKLDLPELNLPNNENKKVIHRRILYFDKQTNQVKEIPEQSLVYLETAYKEFERAKEQYLIWLNQVEYSFKSMKEEEIKRFKADPIVPELFVGVPMDEVIPDPEQD